MDYREFGLENKKVSRIGFGGAPAGLRNYQSQYDPFDKEDRLEAIRSVAYAYENGINYFDTAAGYGAGESEKIMGEALLGVPNDKVYIASKVDFKNRDESRKSIEESLKNLKRDSIDLIQFHGTSYTKADEDRILMDGGLFSLLKEFKDEDLIKSIGFTSEDNNDATYNFINSGKFDMMQIAYNFILQHPYDPIRPFGSILEAKNKGMNISTMRATTSGTLQKWIQMVNPSNDFDYTESLIQFVLSNPYVDVVLVGMRTKEIVKKNLELIKRTEDRVDITFLHERYI